MRKYGVCVCVYLYVYDAFKTHLKTISNDFGYV